LCRHKKNRVGIFPWNSIAVGCVLFGVFRGIVLCMIGVMTLNIFDDGPIDTPVEEISADDVVDLAAPLEFLQKNYPEADIDPTRIMTAETEYIVVEAVEREENAVVLYSESMNVAFPLGTIIPVVGKAVED